MNARQKAKAYKRRLDEIMKRPIQAKVEQHKIDRIKLARCYPKGFIEDASIAYFEESLRRDIAFEIARNLSPYVNYKIYDYPTSREYEIVAEVDVVRIAEEWE